MFGASQIQVASRYVRQPPYLGMSTNIEVRLNDACRRPPYGGATVPDVGEHAREEITELTATQGVDRSARAFHRIPQWFRGSHEILGG